MYHIALHHPNCLTLCFLFIIYLFGYGRIALFHWIKNEKGGWYLKWNGNHIKESNMTISSAFKMSVRVKTGFIGLNYNVNTMPWNRIIKTHNNIRCFALVQRWGDASPGAKNSNLNGKVIWTRKERNQTRKRRLYESCGPVFPKSPGACRPRPCPLPHFQPRRHWKVLSKKIK